MSSPNNKSPSALNLDGAGDEKPRLTEEEKKQNHIASGRYCCMELLASYIILLDPHG